MEIGDRVRMVRQKAGLSQEKFGDSLGITRAAEDNLERGRLKTATSIRPLIKLISQLYNVDEDWLLTGQPDDGRIPYSRDIVDILERRGAGALEAAVIATYLDCNKNDREAIVHILNRIVDTLNELH